MRPDRRHRGGDPHPGRQHRHPGRAARDPRRDRGAAGVQARAAGLRGVSGRHSRCARRRRGRPRVPGGGVQRAGRRRRLHGRLPARLVARCAAAGLLRLGQRLRRPGGVAPRLRAGHADLGGTAGLPARRRAAVPAARRRRPGAAALGHHPHRPLRRTDHPGHGPPQPVRGVVRRGRRRSRAHSRVQGPGHACRASRRAGRPPLRRAAGRALRHARPGGGGGLSVLDRAAHRTAGLVPTGVRVLAGRGHRTGDLAGQPRGQVPGAVPPRRPAGTARAAGAATAAPAGRRPQDPPRAAGRDHRLAQRRGGCAHRGPRHPPALRPGPAAGLVEAGARRRRRGLAQHRAGHPGARPALPRRGAAGTGRAAGDPDRLVRHGRARAHRQGLRGGADHLCRSGGALAGRRDRRRGRGGRPGAPVRHAGRRLARRAAPGGRHPRRGGGRTWRRRAIRCA